MPEEPFYAPDRKPPRRTPPRPGELLWSLRRARDGAVMSCEVRSHDEYGWECQTFLNGEFYYGRRFDLKSGAIEEA
jgi:hypothetical protein